MFALTPIQVILISLSIHVSGGLECGQSNALKNVLTARIVGGTTAELGEFPWQVSIQRIRPRTNEWMHFCGGSIIDEHHILTAAHCLESFKHSYQPGQIRVLAGTIDWRNNMHDKGMQLIQVAKVFVHDGWDRQTGQNDVGLLQTATPIMYTTQNGKITVNRVCLPMDQQEFTTGNALSSGWGFMSKYSRFTPDILRKVEIPIVTYETCKNAFSSVIGITTNQVCAGIVNKGNCMGDSGGPLVVMNDSERATQIGIVSFSIPCAVQGYPDVFTKVSHYLDWIKTKKMNQVDAPMQEMPIEMPSKTVKVKEPSGQHVWPKDWPKIGEHINMK